MPTGGDVHRSRGRRQPQVCTDAVDRFGAHDCHAACTTTSVFGGDWDGHDDHELRGLQRVGEVGLIRQYLCRATGCAASEYKYGWLRDLPVGGCSTHPRVFDLAETPSSARAYSGRRLVMSWGWRKFRVRAMGSLAGIRLLSARSTRIPLVRLASETFSWLQRSRVLACPVLAEPEPSVAPVEFRAG